MKTLLPVALSFVALAACAQNNPASPQFDPAPPPAPEPPRAASKLKRVDAKPGGVPGQPAAPTADAPGGLGGGIGGVSGKGGAVSVNSNSKTVRYTFDSTLPRSTKTGRTLVIQTSNPDPDAINDAEEDLSVMAVILRKATGFLADDKRQAMGIEVDSSVFGSSSGARNIYLEGYGALFLLGVRIPLIAPPDDSAEPKAKAAETSDWAEAREELLNAERDGIEAQIERVWIAGRRQAAEDYEEDKVEQLKTALLESLKNANHIRALKPEENVTVVIQGGEVARKSKSGKPGSSRSRSDSRRSETVMTMRVKKADVDGFASGKLELADFRKKVAVQTYLRRADSSVATSIFSTPK